MLQVTIIFGLTLVGLIKFQKQPAMVFGSCLIALLCLSLVSTEEVVDSFSNHGLLTLILLMTCSLALEKTRILRILATNIIKPSFNSTFVRLFGFTALSSAFLNNSAVVSTMLAPIRNNPHHKSSKLLIPLSYAAILGGTVTLVGTSTNLIVNSMVIDTGLPSLGFFDFTQIGLLLVTGCGIVTFICKGFLPSHDREEQDVRSYVIEAEVAHSSKMIGKSVDQNGLRHLESLFLVEILRGNHLVSPVTPTDIIQPGDKLIFSGDINKVTQLNHYDGLSLFAEHSGLPISNLSEFIVRPESVLLGQTLKSVGFRAMFDAAVVAIKREGTSVSGKLGTVVIESGDTLVLATGPDFSTRKNIQKNFIQLSGVEPEQQLTDWREFLSIGGFFLAIGVSALGWLPLLKSLILFFAVLLFSGALTVQEVTRRLPLQLWLIISAALALSQALSNAGISDYFTAFQSSFGNGISPFTALVIVYLATWLLTELVTNNAAAALVFPIAFAFSTSLGVDPTPYIMAVAFGASASFISPYGYQTNLMVFSAGGYRIADFIKIGVPVCIVYGLITLTAIPLIYGL